MANLPKLNLSSQITIGLAVGAVMAVVLAGVVAWSVSVSADEAARRKERIQVHHALMDRLEGVAKEQGAVTIWDDAVMFIAARDEKWIDENLGEWLRDYFHHDQSFLSDPQGMIVFATKNGKRAIHATADPAGDTNIREMISRVRKEIREHKEKAGEAKDFRANVSVRDIRWIGDRLAAISVRPVIPHSDRIKVPVGSEYLHISLQFLDGEALQRIGHHALVSALRIERAFGGKRSDVAHLAVVDLNGVQTGHLVWATDLFSKALIWHALPLALLSMFLSAVLWIFLGFRLQRTARNLEKSESRAVYQAYHDTLSGLPNRAFLERHLEDRLSDYEKSENSLVLLLLDLDQFKIVNDTFGHCAGDEVVRQAAARLSETVGSEGLPARLGGDEFAVIVETCHPAEVAAALSKSIIANLSRPYILDGDEKIHIGISVGIAAAPADGRSGGELLRKADIALYEAKKRGGREYRIFSSRMDDIVKQRSIIETDLRNSLETGNDIRFVYQPVYSKGGLLIGAEGLFRWDHPVHQALSTAFVIAIAEDCGLIDELGDWVLRKACDMADRIPVPWIAVNVSPMQLQQDAFATRFLSIIGDYNVSAERIHVEITESALIKHHEVANTALQTLHDAGVRVALDDFGTGYASISYLRKYPIDYLKIDRSFVLAMSDDPNGKAVMDAIIRMAHALDLEVTVEGVETTDQRDALVRLGCDHMQGYLFSPPVDAEDFARMFQMGSSNNRDPGCHADVGVGGVVA